MRLGIVNDLAPIVELLRRAVTGDPAHQVIWTAATGAEAIARCAVEVPDLILMDLVMPGMNGVEATRRIMGTTPCPILVVTASVHDHAALVFEAIGEGALDAVIIPTVQGAESTEPLLSKIEMLSRLTATRPNPRRGRGRPADWRRPRQLVAIGSSAGGPAVLHALLRQLPKDFPAAVVIVQHVDGRFATGMAEWLSDGSPLPVRIAVEGERPSPGQVLLAGTSDHLTFKSSDRLGYTAEPRDYVYRPSVDVFFESVSRLWAGDVVGVLLTGMGRDGALGLKALRNRGHHTIAQDEATSAVYGMPKAAALLHAAVEILPLERIAPSVIEHLSMYEKAEG
jgi:two-component system response regulator WspF